VATLVDNKHFFVAAGGQALSQYAAGEAGPDDEVVKHRREIEEVGD
jgi:hypothetical protein